MEKAREYLKQLRTERGLTMQEVAEAFGITRQCYAQVEAGQIQKRMDITLCTRISDYFGIPLEKVAACERSFRGDDEVEAGITAAEQAELDAMEAALDAMDAAAEAEATA